MMMINNEIRWYTSILILNAEVNTGDNVWKSFLSSQDSTDTRKQFWTQYMLTLMHSIISSVIRIFKKREDKRSDSAEHT